MQLRGAAEMREGGPERRGDPTLENEAARSGGRGEEGETRARIGAENEKDGRKREKETPQLTYY